MKITRSKLVNFLSQRLLSDSIGIAIADELIESGLVEIEEEPKEFWVVWGDGFAAKYYFESEKEACDFQNTNKKYATFSMQLAPVAQCNKYEKLWNTLKDRASDYLEKTMDQLEIELSSTLTGNLSKPSFSMPDDNVGGYTDSTGTPQMVSNRKNKEGK